jgi:hypothetical protein
MCECNCNFGLACGEGSVRGLSVEAWRIFRLFPTLGERIEARGFLTSLEPSSEPSPCPLPCQGRGDRAAALAPVISKLTITQHSCGGPVEASIQIAFFHLSTDRQCCGTKAPCTSQTQATTSLRAAQEGSAANCRDATGASQAVF